MMASTVRRWLSTTVRSLLYPQARIKVEGELPYGLRRYLLVQEQSGVDISEQDETAAVRNRRTSSTLIGGVPQLTVLASLTAHRNIVFGAKSTLEEHPISTLCDPLLIQALDDMGSIGEQPQALSALHGLTTYVKQCLDGQHKSPAMQDIQNDETMYAAVRAIATGVPRPGHTVVGPGTHRDAGIGWTALAKEFIQQGHSDECILYQNHGGEMVDIELLADTQPDYLQSAGGAMARFFFVG